MNSHQDKVASIIKDLVTYDRNTGSFHWLERSCETFQRPKDQKTWNKKYAGKKIDNTRKGGYKYIIITLQGVTKLYSAHRVAWLYEHGDWPSGEIDHINRIPWDNRIQNLRDVTATENMKNLSMNSRNTSGFNGVQFLKREKLWQAKIQVNKKSISLGYFKDMESAVKARQEADKRYKFSPTHGVRK